MRTVGGLAAGIQVVHTSKGRGGGRWGNRSCGPRRESERARGRVARLLGGGRLSRCGGHDSAPTVSAGDGAVLPVWVQARCEEVNKCARHVPPKAPNPDASSSSVELGTILSTVHRMPTVLCLRLLMVRAAWRGEAEAGGQYRQAGGMGGWLVQTPSPAPNTGILPFPPHAIVAGRRSGALL